MPIARLAKPPKTEFTNRKGVFWVQAEQPAPMLRGSKWDFMDRKQAILIKNRMTLKRELVLLILFSDNLNYGTINVYLNIKT